MNNTTSLPEEEVLFSLDGLQDTLLKNLLMSFRTYGEAYQLTPEQQVTVCQEIVSALNKVLVSRNPSELFDTFIALGLEDPVLVLSLEKETEVSLCAIIYRSLWETFHPYILSNPEAGMHTFHSIVELLLEGNSREMRRLYRIIDERKQVEEALKHSEMRYRAVVEDQTDLICRFRPDGTLTFVNDAYCRYFGKKREEIIGPTFPALVPVADEEKAKKYYTLFQGRSAAITTHRVISATGEVRWQEWTDRPIFDEHGRLLEFQSVGRDITDSIRAEQGLQIQRDLAIALGSATDQNTVLNLVLHAVLQLEGIDSGLIYALEQPGEKLLLVIQKEFPDVLLEHMTHPHVANYLLDLIQQGSPIYEHARDILTRFFEADKSGRQQKTEMVQVQAMAILPVWSEEQVVAALILASHVSEKIPSSTRKILELIAAQIGGVLARVRAEAALKESEKNLQVLYEQLSHWVQELQQHIRDITLLNGMGEYLQTCFTCHDVYAVVRQFAEQLFPGQPGALYILDVNHNVAETVTQWGDGITDFRVFAATDCWALRRGQSHIVDETYYGPRCAHMAGYVSRPYLCVPLIAQGKILGVFHLYNDSSCTHEMRERWLQLVTMVAEHVAMALANLHLRDQLQEQAIRDPLTGLYNRRYLDDALGREYNRATRHQRSVGIVMLDIDHFKMFNDTYGHEAGDAMLRAVGDFLKQRVRGEDIPCRYGGEEFTLILPNATLDDTYRKAEDLLNHIRHLQIQYRGSLLATITVSMGVASFPGCGETLEQVLHAADIALLKAKEQGRDRVVIAETK